MQMKKPSMSIGLWSMRINNVISIKQSENETVVSHYKRLVNMIKVTESKWGLILSTKMVEADIDYASKPKEIKKAVRDKFLACVFLSGLRKKKFSKCLDDLNNSFLARQNKHPIDMEAALNCVSGHAHALRPSSTPSSEEQWLAQ